MMTALVMVQVVVYGFITWDFMKIQSWTFGTMILFLAPGLACWVLLSRVCYRWPAFNPTALALPAIAPAAVIGGLTGRCARAPGVESANRQRLVAV
jgi:hypothetical protein